MTDSTTRTKGRLRALGSAGVAGLAVVCCAAGPLIVALVAGAGVGGLIGGLGGALLVSALVATAVMVLRARGRGACGPDGCRVPGDRGLPPVLGRDGA